MDFMAHSVSIPADVTKAPATSKAPALQDSTTLEPGKGKMNPTTPTTSSKGTTITEVNTEAQNDVTTTTETQNDVTTTTTTEAPNATNLTN